MIKKVNNLIWNVVFESSLIAFSMKQSYKYIFSVLFRIILLFLSIKNTMTDACNIGERNVENRALEDNAGDQIVVDNTKADAGERNVSISLLLPMGQHTTTEVDLHLRALGRRRRGAGGGAGGGHVPPHFQKWGGGAQVCLCPPHFWAEQIF